MSRNSKNCSPSLLDSIYYRNALRKNFVETNRLQKQARMIQSDREVAIATLNQEWQNIYHWKEDIEKTTETANVETLTQLVTETSQKQNPPVPECYFMYGMRIGKSPKLLKHFIGKQQKKKTALKDEQQLLKNQDNRKTNHDKYHSTDNCSSEDPTDKQECTEIMIGNTIVRQIPIGYNSYCVHRRVQFTDCTSHTMEKCNVHIPGYYTLRYKYILPPASMHR